MKRFYGTPQAKINTGLDDKVYNKKIALEREKERKREYEQKMENPLLYPNGKKSLRD